MHHLSSNKHGTALSDPSVVWSPLVAASVTFDKVYQRHEMVPPVRGGMLDVGQGFTQRQPQPSACGAAGAATLESHGRFSRARATSCRCRQGRSMSLTAASSTRMRCTSRLNNSWVNTDAVIPLRRLAPARTGAQEGADVGPAAVRQLRMCGAVGLTARVRWTHLGNCNRYDTFRVTPMLTGSNGGQ